MGDLIASHEYPSGIPSYSNNYSGVQPGLSVQEVQGTSKTSAHARAEGEISLLYGLLSARGSAGVKYSDQLEHSFDYNLGRELAKQVAQQMKPNALSVTPARNVRATAFRAAPSRRKRYTRYRKRYTSRYPRYRRRYSRF